MNSIMFRPIEPEEKNFVLPTLLAFITPNLPSVKSGAESIFETQNSLKNHHSKTINHYDAHEKPSDEDGEPSFLANRKCNKKYMEGNKHGIAKYFHGLLNEVLLSFRKFYRDEVGGANTKTSFSNLYETPTLQKVLANLQRYKYVINDKYSEIPHYGGYIH